MRKHHRGPLVAKATGGFFFRTQNTGYNSETHICKGGAIMLGTIIAIGLGIYVKGIIDDEIEKSYDRGYKKGYQDGYKKGYTNGYEYALTDWFIDKKKI